ncbi:MAG: streptogrisin [Gaiellales bacterium]|jgi:streptogrisin D|nr:streptogrisin [Gaiellales bacterium]
MKLGPSTTSRRWPIALTALGVVVATAVALPAANASERRAAAGGTTGTPSTMAAMTTTMNDTSAGGYTLADGTTVVNVTDQAAAERVTASGAKARMVRYSGSTLKATEAQLRATATIPGTSWVADPRTNRVVVSADESVTGAGMAQLRDAVARIGGTVRMRQVAGTLSTRITGGDAIFTGNARCSLGFNVLRGNQAFFLTAGHCTANAGAWFADQNGQQLIGQTVASSFPGDDFGLVQFAQGVIRPGAVLVGNGIRRDINQAGQAVVGQQVERSGSTTGLHSGTVTGVNATVNYAEGTVTGLIQTNVCAEPGDSGGSLVSGSTALGMTSGGSGDCTQGGETFFQPVLEPLQKFGLQVY